MSEMSDWIECAQTGGRDSGSPNTAPRTGAERYLVNRLAEPTYAHAYKNASNAQWLRAELEAAETHRDALAARLAALPEVPDGHEVLVVPSEFVDFARSQWCGSTDEGSPWSALDDAVRAAVDRRPEPEPQVEPFKGRVIDAGGGEVRIVIDRDTMQYPPVGSRVEVLAEDGES